MFLIYRCGFSFHGISCLSQPFWPSINVEYCILHYDTVDGTEYNVNISWDRSYSHTWRVPPTAD